MHIRDLLQNINARSEGLILRFGGHAAAAGLTIHETRLSQFSEAFEQEIDTLLNGISEPGVLLTDGSLDNDLLTLEFAQLIESSGPWGQGFPQPVFDDEFKVLDSRVVGDAHLKLKLSKSDDRQGIDAISFFYEHKHGMVEPMDKIRAAFQLEVNHYNGVRSPQLNVQYLELAGG